MLNLFSTVLVLIVAVVSAYDWNCNHYDSWATDVCYEYSSSTEYLFKCNGTNEIIWYEYNNGECGVKGSIPTHVTTKQLTSSGNFECSKKESCDFTRVTYWSDEYCDGTYHYDWEDYIIGQCYPSSIATITSFNYISYKYECSGDTLKLTTYANANCSGTSFTTITSYNDDYNDQHKGCYKMTCCMFKIYIITLLFFFMHPCIYVFVYLCVCV